MSRMPRCERFEIPVFSIFLFCPNYVNLIDMKKGRPAIEELSLSDAFMDCGARSFRNMGVSLDKISKATGLSEEKIASL